MVESVRPRRTDNSNAEMGMIGYMVAAPLALLLLPVLPFLILLWLGSKLVGTGD